MIKYKSEVGLSYQTIKITKSRLYKGLLAVPVSLSDKFPAHKKKVQIFLDDSETPEFKNFTPYNSKSKEIRIGGLSKWFLDNNFQNQDEIVIDFIDEQEGIYRLRKEVNFLADIKKIEHNLMKGLEIYDEENVVENEIKNLLKKTNLTEEQLLINQYTKIKDLPISQRVYKKANTNVRKENVPILMRKILEFFYKGKCQISDFTFLQRNGKPYFEIHHIDENRGNDWKNLLVVCPNIHAQFTYGNYKNYFNEDGWLEEVDFDGNLFKVKQVLKDVNTTFEKVIYE
jgi:hypothetical protein